MLKLPEGYTPVNVGLRSSRRPGMVVSVARDGRIGFSREVVSTLGLEHGKCIGLVTNDSGRVLLVPGAWGPILHKPTNGKTLRLAAKHLWRHLGVGQVEFATCLELTQQAGEDGLWGFETRSLPRLLE